MLVLVSVRHCRLRRLLFLHIFLFGPVNHGQNWRGWERRGEKGLIISDNQAQTCLIITINDTSTGDLPLLITSCDTCKNQPKRLDFDNTINLSSLIVSLDGSVVSPVATGYCSTFVVSKIMLRVIIDSPAIG